MLRLVFPKSAAALASSALILTACGQKQEEVVVPSVSQTAAQTPITVPDIKPAEAPEPEPTPAPQAVTPEAQEDVPTSPALATTATVIKPIFATPLPAPDVPTYMSALEQELASISAEGAKQMPQETAQRISLLFEQLARGKETANLTPEQSQAIDATLEAVEKEMNRAVSAQSPDEYQDHLVEIRRLYENLQSQLAQQ